MPAPSAALISATRNGTAARHEFFEFLHPAGAIRVWNGVGEFLIGGLVYSGIGGLGGLSGISDSVEIQQHEITCYLNNVGLSALRADDGDVRGAPAKIVSAMIDEHGAIVYSRIVFLGVGDVLKSKVHERQARFTLTLRSYLADWSTAPKAFYTPQDQQRLYATDSGFDYVKSLQDSTIAGWSKNEESSGSYVLQYIQGTPFVDTAVSAFSYALAADANLRAIGNNLYGVGFGSNASGYLSHWGPTVYEEQDGLTNLGRVTDDGSAYLYLQSLLSGQRCYVDTSGDVRTANGKLVCLGQDTTKRLRQAAAITSNGTATATTISGTVPTGSTGAQVVLHKTGTVPNVATNDWTTAVFCNECGALMFADGVSTRTLISLTGAPLVYTTHTYVEETTGNAATLSGGLLKVSGSNCFVSTTGIILTAANRRIVRSGGTSNQFLRVWT